MAPGLSSIAWMDPAIRTANVCTVFRLNLILNSHKLRNSTTPLSFGSFLLPSNKKPLLSYAFLRHSLSLPFSPVYRDVKGELIRTNTRERQKGIALYIDYQIIDVNTCQPVPNVFLDSWHPNSTGVYAGVVACGNGDITDLANVYITYFQNVTFARGITNTDRHGVTFLETKLPGHYTGRTAHIHVLATVNATVAKNGTLVSGHIAHVGQVFFDQDLITKVETNSPYTTNTQPLLLNKDDFIFAEEAASTDPVLNYVWLGKKQTDDIFAWITVGIDTQESYDSQAAVFWTKNGGVVNPDTRPGSGNPGGPGSPSCAPPSGFPSGVLTSH